MDYLRNLGSAAVSSLVQKSGLNLPFTLGQRVGSFDGHTIWTLYDATKRDDGSAVSVFEFDGAKHESKLLPLAKNALRKLRTVRHPDVLKFIDVVETDSTVLIMTERVRPLSSALETWRSKPAREKEDWLLWGLHRISVALAFVNDAADSTHGNVSVNSVFISPSGEWRLGGFEVLSTPKDEGAILYTLGGLVPDAAMHSSPEVKKGGWSALKEHDRATADAYALGLLLHSVFNPDHPPPPTAQPPHPPPAPSSRGAIPTIVFPAYKRLLNPSSKARLTPKGFLELGMAQTAGDGSGFFVNNKLVKVCAGLDNFALSSESDKASFLRTLKDSVSSFPPEFASFKVLPSLVSALEYGGAAAASIIPLVLQIGQHVPTDDYPNIVLNPLVKLFANPDRGTRMALLDHLSEYADRLDKKMVVDKIWPNLQTGFADTVAVIREATVKSIITLSPKLNERILNNELLRHLAKLQADPEASIRTNTCILIGRLGPSLGYNTKKKVLVSAFGRALKDPFVHARVAGLMAFMATVECYDSDDLAQKVLPTVCGSMIDKEKLVRDQAFKAVELFVKKLEEYASTMPETSLNADGSTPNPSFVLPATTDQATLVNSAAGAAGALAGWAISSLGRKLAPSDMQSTITADPALPTTSGFPASSPALTSTLSSPDLNQTHTANVAGKAKGMQLGANKVPTSTLAAAWADEDMAPPGGLSGSTWGAGDLMDMNADEGDWTAFESAPAPAVDPDDDWGDVSGTSTKVDAIPDPWTADTTPVYPTLSTTPRKAAAAPSRSPAPPRSPSLAPSRIATSTSPSRSSTPAAPSSPEPAAAASNTAGMTKEERAAEMARRKEERRQRIEKLKEQKKGAPQKA